MLIVHANLLGMDINFVSVMYASSSPTVLCSPITPGGSMIIIIAAGIGVILMVVVVVIVVAVILRVCCWRRY